MFFKAALLIPWGSSGSVVAAAEFISNANPDNFSVRIIWTKFVCAGGTGMPTKCPNRKITSK